MKGRKKKALQIDLDALRKELYVKHLNKIHPVVRRSLEMDGVLDEVCHKLVNLEFQDKRLTYFESSRPDFTRLYDYNMDAYIHVHYNGKNYRFDMRKVEG